MWAVYDKWGKLMATFRLYDMALSYANAIGGVVIPTT